MAKIDFEYIDPQDLGRGKHRQTIIYDSREVGYLFMREMNILAPIEERYVIPDVEIGMSEPTPGLLKGKKGWIEFKSFVDYEEANKYVEDNLEEISYLWEYGDCD